MYGHQLQPFWCFTNILAGSDQRKYIGSFNPKFTILKQFSLPQSQPSVKSTYHLQTFISTQSRFPKYHS